MKIINYPYRKTIKASEFNAAIYEATRYNVNSVGPLIVAGLSISTSGLDVTITKGNGYCGDVVLPWIYNKESSTTDFSPSGKWNAVVVLNADTTLTVAPNATTYLALQETIDSTAPYQDEYNTATSLVALTAPTGAIPSGNVIGELLIAEIVTDTVSVTSVTYLSGNLTNVNTLASQFAALQLTVTQLANQTKVAVQYDVATNTPDITTDTPTTLQKKLIFVKGDGVATVNGVPTQLYHGDIVTSDGASVIVNSQKFWSN